MKNFAVIKNKIKKFNKKIFVPGDKSLSIRTVLLASQGVGVSNISNLLEAEDVLNSLAAIKKLGIKYTKVKKKYRIYGLGLNGYSPKKNTTIYAGNSGTLGRHLLALLVKVNKKIKLTGDRSLSKRDFSRIAEPLKLFGANIKLNNKFLPVDIVGTNFLRPINYFENIGSAQVKSSICFAALNTPGTTVIKAKKSRNHTELLFKNLNIPIKLKSSKNFDLIKIKGLNNYKSFNYSIPGDISSSAFFIVLTMLSNKSKILIRNVNVNETRTGIIKILKKMKANIVLKNKKKYKGEMIADIQVTSSPVLKSINCPPGLNSSTIDELILIFLVAGVKTKGVSTFKDLSELNKKESPRLDLAINFLRMIGVKVKRNKNDIKIYGKPNLSLDGAYLIKNFLKDHRIFMMSCVAALTLGGKWKIFDKDSINTSFPSFIKILKKLGAKIN